MLFLLKRNWRGGLLGLVVLVPLGLAVRHCLDDVPPVGASWANLGWGVVVLALVLVSDLLLHVLLRTVFREAYLLRYRELAQVFREQTAFAILIGAVLAGLGEELLFRGFTTRYPWLIAAVIPFALLHHIRRSLWPFTLWAGYQGLLFVGALHLFGCLFVTMTAHFLHDFLGFLAFRVVNSTLPDWDRTGSHNF